MAGPYKIATRKEAGHDIAGKEETSISNPNKCVLKSELAALGCELKSTAQSYESNQAVRLDDIKKIIYNLKYKAYYKGADINATISGTYAFASGQSFGLRTAQYYDGINEVELDAESSIQFLLNTGAIIGGITTVTNYELNFYNSPTSKDASHLIGSIQGTVNTVIRKTFSLSEIENFYNDEGQLTVYFYFKPITV